MVEFFSTEISAMVCRVRSCSATGCWVMMSAASPSFDGRLIFAFGSDDLGAALALGLGFLGHRTLHVVGQRDVLDLDRRDLGAPRLGVLVDHVLDLVVDAGRVRQELVEAEPPDHVAHGGLADLVDRVVDVLDGDDGSFRVGDVIVGHGRDIDRDVVPGDDLLRRDLHGDGAQRHPHHLLDRNEDQRQPRPAHAGKPAEQEHHTALILPEHAKRNDDIDDEQYDNDGNEAHGVSSSFFPARSTDGAGRAPRRG